MYVLITINFFFSFTINFLLRVMSAAYRMLWYIMVLLARDIFCLGFFFDPLVVPSLLMMKIDVVG